MLTIGIPCYKGAHNLPAILHSLRQQTYPNIEVIVCDDYSPDKDAEEISRHAANYGVRHIRTSDPNERPSKRRSLAHTYNEIASAARNGIVMLMDNDVILPRVFADTILAYMKRNQCAALGVAATRVGPEEFASRAIVPGGLEATGEPTVEVSTELAGYCLVFYRHMWNECRFDTRYNYYLQDSDFCCAVSRKYSLPTYRLHYPKPWHLEHATLDVHGELRAKQLLANDLLAFHDKWHDTPKELDQRISQKYKHDPVQVYAGKGSIEWTKPQ